MNLLKNKNEINAWLSLISASLFYQFALFQMNIFSTIGELYYIQVQISNDIDRTLLLSVFFYIQMLFSIPIGVLLDYVSVRKVLVISSFFAVIGLIGFLFSTNFFSAVIFRIFLGSAVATAFFCCMKLADILFEESKKAYAITVSVSIAMFGSILSQYPLKIFLDNFAYDITKYGIIAYGIIVMFTVILLVKEPEKIFEGERWENKLIFQEVMGIIGFFSVRNAKYVAIYSACMNIPITLLGAGLFNGFLLEKFSLSSDEISLLNAIFFIALLIGGPFLGKISNSLFKQKIIMLLSAFSCFALLLLLLLVNGVDAVFFTGVVFAFFGVMISAQAIGYAMLSETVFSSVVGKTYGVAGTMIMLFIAVSMNISGWLASYLRFNTLISSNFAAIMIALFSIILSIFCVLKIKIIKE